MGNLPKDKIGLVSKEHVCEGKENHGKLINCFFIALILLLKDNSSLVRASTAEALSLLYDY